MKYKGVLTGVLFCAALAGARFAPAAQPLNGQYEGYDFGIAQCLGNDLSDFGQGCILRTRDNRVQTLSWRDWIVRMTGKKSAVVTDIRMPDNSGHVNVYYIYNPQE